MRNKIHQSQVHHLIFFSEINKGFYNIYVGVKEPNIANKILKNKIVGLSLMDIKVIGKIAELNSLVLA